MSRYLFSRKFDSPNSETNMNMPAHFRSAIQNKTLHRYTMGCKNRPETIKRAITRQMVQRARVCTRKRNEIDSVNDLACNLAIISMEGSVLRAEHLVNITIVSFTTAAAFNCSMGGLFAFFIINVNACKIPSCIHSRTQGLTTGLSPLSVF